MNRKTKNDLLFLADAEIKHVHVELGINDRNDFHPEKLPFSVCTELPRKLAMLLVAVDTVFLRL